MKIVWQDKTKKFGWQVLGIVALVMIAMYAISQLMIALAPTMISMMGGAK